MAHGNLRTPLLLILARLEDMTGYVNQVDLQILNCRIKHTSPSGPASVDLKARLFLWQEVS